MRAKANKLNKPEDGNFGKTWNYICDQHDISECFKPGFFNTIGGNLMAGDQIRMIRMQGEKRVLGVCDGIVIQVETTKMGWVVDFHPMQSTVLDFKDVPTSDQPAAEPEEAGPEFIKGTGKVEWNINKKHYSVFDDGREVCIVYKKSEAHAISRGDKPIPVLA